MKDDFKSFDQAMAGMVQSGYGKQAAVEFATIEAAAKKAGRSTEEIAALFPDYQAAVAAAAAEQELAVAGMGLFGQQALDVKTKLDAQRASADGLRGAIQALNDVNRAALGGMIGFEAAIDAADKAAEKNAGSLKMINGELDLNSPKAQAAATALQDLGTKTDGAAASAREQGRSWEYVNGIYKRGEQAIIKAGQAMGLEEDQAKALAASILGIPKGHETKVEMRTEDAIAGLDSVLAAMKATPGSKSVTVKALTESAIEMLRSLGFTVERMPDGQFKVIAQTGNARSNIAAVQAARDALNDKTITITTNRVVTEQRIVSTTTGESRSRTKLRAGSQADGGVVSYYANGGMNALPGPFPSKGKATSPRSPLPVRCAYGPSRRPAGNRMYPSTLPSGPAPAPSPRRRCAASAVTPQRSSGTPKAVSPTGGTTPTADPCTHPRTPGRPGARPRRSRSRTRRGRSPPRTSSTSPWPQWRSSSKPTARPRGSGTRTWRRSPTGSAVTSPTRSPQWARTVWPSQRKWRTGRRSTSRKWHPPSAVCPRRPRPA
ncbi:hypothetical protein [Streptomyces microflavus]|uniref:hypothetical protein n=1 Tax=Streptomyces microflavus TaxID=1919 RepID=UPI003B21E1CB